MKYISSVQGCQEQTLFKIKASGNQSLEFFVNTACIEELEESGLTYPSSYKMLLLSESIIQWS